MRPYWWWKRSWKISVPGYAWLWIATVVSLSSTVGCRGRVGSAPEPDTLLEGAAGAPTLVNSERPVPTQYSVDAVWSKAMSSDDPIDLASLADREGASGLLEAVEMGDRVGVTALAALPMADDATVAFRRLAQLALLTSGEAQMLVLHSINGIALRSSRYGEPIDEGGAALCAKALLTLATNPHVPIPQRAVVISTLRFPVFASRVDAKLIPSSLDAPPPALLSNTLDSESASH